MTDEYPVALVVDASGTRCPVPLLRAKQGLKSINVGEYLQVLATDPSAKGDFDAMLSHLPHELIEYQHGVGEPRVDLFIIRKGE